MEHRPQIRASRNSGKRGKEIKSRVKARGEKSKYSGGHPDETQVRTPEEIAGKTINILCNLGRQRFALPPFSDYYQHWLENIGDAMSEFESSPNIHVDDQFVSERSQLLSNLKRQLEEGRRKEISRNDSVKILHETRILFDGIEKEYTTGKKEIEREKNAEIMRLSNSIDDLRGELVRVAQMRAGLFGEISKKAKAQKESELSQRQSSAEKDLTTADQNFANDLENIRNEYEKRKEEVISRMADLQKEIENQEIDASLETRQATCDALTNAIKAMTQRSQQTRKP
jgi:hypothetical protein